MASIIFFASYLFYIVFLTHLTNFYWIPLWIVVGFAMAFLTLLLVYLLHFPLVMVLPTKNRYKAYLMKSISFFLNRFILGLNVQIEGVENVPLNSPIVVYANHKSYTDGFAVMQVFPRPIALSPKKSVLKIPLLKWWLKAYDVFPINRSSARDTVAMMDKAVKTIQGGHPILMFPEGTIKRRLHEDVETMRAGSFKLALRAKADIIIIRLDGNDLVRKRWPFRRSGRKLTVLPILAYETFKDLSTQELAAVVMDKINQAAPTPKS